MNNIILTVMRYLNNPESVSLEVLKSNAANAANAVNANASAINKAIADAAAVVFDAANAANTAANDVASVVIIADAGDAYWVNEYFKISGENKQTYINAIEAGK